MTRRRRSLRDMPERFVEFPWVRFPPHVLREAVDTYEAAARTEHPDAKMRWTQMSVQTGNSTWQYDNEDEFLAALHDPYNFGGAFVVTDPLPLDHTISFSATDQSSRIGVHHPKRQVVQAVMSIFESEAPKHLVEPPPKPKPTVFIGHGHSTEWLRLKGYLQDQMGIRVEAYETGSRAGHAIRDVLASMIRSTSFALLVMTGEDVQPDGKVRARQNVVHEAGLFQGALGFERAIVLLEDDVEEFSNLAGIQYLPFRKDSIRDAFGDVIAALKREFPGSL